MESTKCNGCGEIKPDSQYYARKGKRWGRVCKTCTNTRQKEYHSQHKERHLVNMRKYNAKLKAEAMNAYGGSCSCCGESRLAFLSLDHVNRDGGEHRRSAGRTSSGPSFYRMLRDAKWPNDPPLRVMCFNCNFASYWGTCPHQEKGGGLQMENLIVTAIDPGDVHHGVVSMIVGGRGGIEPYLAKEMTSQEDLYRYVEKARPDYLVLEEFRLYPFQARNQGFSDFPTPQTIGALKYIASRMPTKVVMQKAMVKKEARTIALAQGVPMSVRALGSGKGAYKGPDFDAAWMKKEFGCKSSQHVRDAMAHGYFWAYTSPDSPARLST